jgi:hypothetical protein
VRWVVLLLGIFCQLLWLRKTECNVFSRLNLASPVSPMTPRAFWRHSGGTLDSSLASPASRCFSVSLIAWIWNAAELKLQPRIRLST